MDISTWRVYLGFKYKTKEIRIINEYNEILYSGGIDGISEFDSYMIDSILDMDEIVILNVYQVEDSAE